MFYGVEVWRLSRPYHNLKSMLSQQLLGLSTGMFGIIILLKDMDGLGRDGMVLDILKGLGDLDSILSLSSIKKLGSMSHISGGNDQWTTTSGFGKIGTVFSANMINGGVTESSGSRDLTSCLIQFQESNNLVDLISGKGLHDERSGKSDGVWLCLHYVELFKHHMTQC